MLSVYSSEVCKKGAYRQVRDMAVIGFFCAVGVQLHKNPQAVKTVALIYLGQTLLEKVVDPWIMHRVLHVKSLKDYAQRHHIGSAPFVLDAVITFIPHLFCLIVATKKAGFLYAFSHALFLNQIAPTLIKRFIYDLEPSNLHQKYQKKFTESLFSNIKHWHKCLDEGSLGYVSSLLRSLLGYQEKLLEDELKSFTL